MTNKFAKIAEAKALESKKRSIKYTLGEIKDNIEICMENCIDELGIYPEDIITRLSELHCRLEDIGVGVEPPMMPLPYIVEEDDRLYVDGIPGPLPAGTIISKGTR